MNKPTMFQVYPPSAKTNINTLIFGHKLKLDQLYGVDHYPWLNQLTGDLEYLTEGESPKLNPQQWVMVK